MNNTTLTAGSSGKGLVAMLIPCVLLVFLTACRHTLPDLPTHNGTTPADTGVCFERDVLPVFITYCTRSGCHDDVTMAGGYAFTSYQSVTAHGITPGNAMASLVYKDIANGSMPWYPNPQLSAVQKSTIAKWINEGAKNTTACTPACDSDNCTFAAGVQPLIRTYCIGCHSGHSAAGGISLDTYQGVLAVAADGRLTGSIRHESGYTFMPGNNKQLTGCEIRQVEKWMAAGALNN